MTALPLLFGAILACGGTLALHASDGCSLSMERRAFTPSESIVVSFQTPSGVPGNSWIGIIPAEVEHGSRSTNDRYDVQYQYLKERTEGELTFNPVNPGKWTFRMNVGDKETATVAFEVADDVVPPGQHAPSLILDRTRFAPSEAIVVKFTAPAAYPSSAWVGIIPAEVEHGSRSTNDRHDVQYQYLKEQTDGELAFSPVAAGKWTLRMNAFQIETASVEFEVAADVVPEGLNLPALAVEHSEFAPGEEIKVHFAAPEIYPDSSWIGIVPAEVAHGSRSVNDKHDVQYQYLKGATEGAMTFRSPGAGQWSARMNAFDIETASVSFSVVEGLSPQTSRDSSFTMKIVKSAGENGAAHRTPPGEPDVGGARRPVDDTQRTAIPRQTYPEVADGNAVPGSRDEGDDAGDEKPGTSPDSIPEWILEMPPLSEVMPAQVVERLDLRGISREEYAGIVSQAKETVAELLGPMSPEQADVYERSWRPVFSYPAPECIDYLEQVIPIAERALSLRMSLVQVSKSTSELWERAAFAEYYSPEAAREIMLQVRARTALLQSIKLSMNQLIEQLEALGDPPDPGQLQARAQERHRKAMRSLESLLGGSPELEGYYERTASVSSTERDPQGHPIYVGRRSEDRLQTLAIKPLQGSRSDLVLYSQLEYHEPSGSEGTLDSILDDAFEDESWSAWYAEATEDGWANYDYDYDEEDESVEATFYRPGYDEMTVDRYWIHDGRVEATRDIYHRAPLDPGTKLYEDGQDEASIRKLVRDNRDALTEQQQNFRAGKAAFARHFVQKGAVPPLANPDELYWVLKDIRVDRSPEPKTKEERFRGEGSDFSYQDLRDFDSGNNHLSTTWTDVAVTWSYDSSDEAVEVPKGSAYIANPDEEFVGGGPVAKSSEKRTPRAVSIHWEQAPPVVPDGAFWTIDPTIEGEGGIFAINSILVPQGDGYGAMDVPSLAPVTLGDSPRGLLILPHPIYADVRADPEEEKALKHQVFGQESSHRQPMSVSLRSARLQAHECTVPIIVSAPTGYVRLDCVYEQRLLDEDAVRELASSMEGSMPTITLSEAQRRHDESRKRNESDEAQLAELKAEREARIAFHEANIAFSKQEANRLRSQMEALQAKLRNGNATEEEVGLLNQLNFRLVSQQSNMVAEQDRIVEEKTGESTHSRTPFDEMCRTQMIQKCRESVRELDGGIRSRRKAEYLMEKMDPEQKRIALRILDKISANGGGLYADDYRELNDAMQNIFQGNQEFEQAQLEEQAAYENAFVEGAEYVKTGADVGLMVTSLGGGPMYVNIVYQAANGYVEKGPIEGLKRGISTYSDAADILISGYDGWKSGGFWGALEGASLSVLMNKGPEVAMGRLKFSKGFDGGYRPIGIEGAHAPRPELDAPGMGKAPNKGAEAIEAAKFQQEMEYGEALAKDYFHDYSQWKTAQIKGDTNSAEFKQLEMRVRQKAAAVAHSMPAKSYLKYTAPGRMGQAFTEVHTEVLGDAVKSFNLEMKQLGYNEQTLMQFRNMSSLDPGMDADLGLIEKPDFLRIKNADGTVTLKENHWLTRNGKPVTLEQWQIDARKVMAANYKHVSGGYSAHQSFVDVTTSVHPESYRDKNWLLVPKVNPHSDVAAVTKVQDRIFGQVIPEYTPHSLGVTVEKAEIMFKEHPELRPLGSMMETCRGTAKDLDTKFIPLVDAKIRELEAIPTGKRSPDVAQKLRELNSTRQYLDECRSCLGDIGKGRTHPGRWMNDFRMITGGEDPVAVTKRLAKLTLDASRM